MDVCSKKTCRPRRAFEKQDFYLKRRYLPSSKSPVLPLLVVRMWNVFLVAFVDASLHAHQLLGRTRVNAPPGEI